MSAGFWDCYPQITDAMLRTRQLLARGGGDMPGPLSEAVRELLGDCGKLLRPGFVILAGRFGRYDERKICQLAAAVEMFHLGTLVHDDIVDDAELRRGRPSLALRLGARDAVLVGDWLLARSFLIMAAHASAASARAFARAASRLCAGEVREVAGERAIATDAWDYFRRIEGKTAALFSACFRLGATESDCPPQLSERLAWVGHYLGMSFQIVDDILDIEGDSNLLGKPVGQDLRHGVYTLPVIYALATPARRELEPLLDAQQRAGVEDAASLRRIVELLEETRAIERARLAARRYSDRALRLIERLPRIAERAILADATARLTERAA